MQHAPTPRKVASAVLLAFFWLSCTSTALAAGDIRVSTTPHAKANASTTPGREVTLNLRNADIRSLISAVSKATGINFVVDPRVHGKVTVISSTPMDRTALYRVFLSVLEVYGYTAVPSGSVVKIIPSVNARQNALLSGQGAEVVTRVVQMHNMPASQIVPMLKPLVSPNGLIAAYAPNNTLILTDRASNVAKLTTLIHELDTTNNRRVDLIKLHHASAGDVAQTLNTLLQQEDVGSSSQGMSKPYVTADTRSNSVLIAGGRKARERLRKLIKELDVPLPSTGDSHVVFLKYATAKTVAKLLDGVVKDLQSSGASGKGGTTKSNIQADASINALIITAPNQEARQLAELARRLDVRPAEVLIEAVIAEISGDYARKLGTQFGVLPSSSSQVGTGAAANFTNGAVSLASLISNPASIGTGLLLGFGSLKSGQTRYGVLLNALRSNAGTDILSTPSLLTLDNKKAEIVVGKNVPFVTGRYSVTSNSANSASVSSPFQTIERKNVGITLKVTPQINQGKNLRMKIDLTVSSLAPSVTGAADLITNTRQIKTSVVAGSGSIIVLGGLIDNSYQSSTQKVPLLGDIPGLGLLFRSTSRERTKTNLMIFLHPVIINDQRAADFYSRRKYDLLRSQQQISNRTLGHGTQLPKKLNNLVYPPAKNRSPAVTKRPSKAKSSANRFGHRFGHHGDSRMCPLC